MNGYGRDLEDQADRVGLRYAHEPGFNVSAAPAVWQRFLDKYGDQRQGHQLLLLGSLDRRRARKNLEQELRFNYPRWYPAVDLGQEMTLSTRP